MKRETFMAAMGCKLAGYPCDRCTDRDTPKCIFPDVAKKVMETLEKLNAGIEVEGMVMEEDDETDADFYKKHFGVRK